MPALVKKFKESVLNEFVQTYKDVRNQKITVGLFFAVLFVVMVIIGNVLWLIAQNFWYATLTETSSGGNSISLAILLITILFIEAVFMLLAIVFAMVYGVKEMWHAVVDTNRMRGPLYRFAVLIASGVLNGSSSVLQVYSFTHTPMLLQSILLCTIPLSAQVWTLIFIPEERKRDYLSFFFIVSFILLVAGIFIPSASTFKEASEDDAKGVSLAWTFIYFLSCVVFGLWCVTQRLYLDALIVKEPKPQNSSENVDKTTQPAADASESPSSLASDVILLAEKRSWGRQNVREISGKLVLLVGSILFQIILVIVLIPIDAIPWFGTSSSASDAAKGFSESFKLIFSSWHNIRYGLLTSFGTLLSFVGCTYLNEESPTLASVVLQIAGPFTSLVIIVFPQWNVYGDKAEPGYKVGGVVLLFVAAFLYHMWEQISLQKLLNRVHEPERQMTEEASPK
ncbi:unnamed protein product [Phytomonas sp. EM1]|nr:unnamed protein product [Phytomonas sp. EM1]|eukprot:CCW62545.1 unnamed protein product [Phytomonas sp. isolate EM1]